MKKKKKIGVGPGSATKRWPSRKSREKDLFFWGEKKLPKFFFFFLHISSSYAKILGETNFHAREIPRSGWKVEGGEERKKKKEEEEKSRWKQWPASLRTPPRVAHASTPGPILPIIIVILSTAHKKGDGGATRCPQARLAGCPEVISHNSYNFFLAPEFNLNLCWKIENQNY